MAGRKLKSIPELVVIFLISFVVGILAALVFFARLIVKGPRHLLYTKERNVRPEVLCNNEFGTHEFLMLKTSRMKIHCVINGPKDKPLMLMLHGFPEFWYSWRFQLKEFCKEYRVCAIDMRGYGESDKPPRARDYHSDELTDDVRQVITLLGYKNCVLMAHDWGGAVAWMFSMRYPDMVNKLIICNGPHPVAFQKHVIRNFQRIIYMFFFQVPLLPLLEIRANDLYMIGAVFCGKKLGARKGTFTAEDIEAYKYNLAEYHDLLGPVNYYRAMMRYTSPDWLVNVSGTKISSPVLVVWGTMDGALSKEMAEMSGEFAVDFTLKWVEGASHWVQQEEPRAVNQLIWDFLKRHH